MTRRKPYTRLAKANQRRADHVKGMGDVGFKCFQCLNPECTEVIFVRSDDVVDDFLFACPACGFVHEDGGSTSFYDYILERIDPDRKDVQEVIESGEFDIDHHEYIYQSPDYKYCIICNTAKPLSAFDNHAARKTGRQGECRQCKAVYNSIKNQTRTTDQHREAAQKRRLYIEVSGGTSKIDSHAIFDRFDGTCFKCGKVLVDNQGNPIAGTYQLDHTLPAFYLWPLTTDNGTLLCSACNNEKSGKWPSNFYTIKELQALQVKTGLDFDLLSGEPQMNPNAISSLSDVDTVEALLTKYGAYMDEMIKLRNRILEHTGFDFFEVVKGKIARRWVDDANALLKK